MANWYNPNLRDEPEAGAVTSLEHGTMFERAE